MTPIHLIPEEILMASSAYRAHEKEVFDAGVGPAMQSLSDSHPHLMPEISTGWATILEAVSQHFDEQKAFWKKHRRADQVPKVYEFHHTITVARQCFQIGVVEAFKQSEGASVDVDHAVENTLQRLGLRGEFSAFLHEKGFLQMDSLEDISTSTESDFQP